MTEPNKELPKEVEDEINKSDYAFYEADGARIAQSHYAPIIEAKDKEIADIYGEMLKWKVLYNTLDVKRIENNKLVNKQLSEKDKIIELLNDRIEDKRDVEEQYLDWFHAQKGKPTQSEIVAEKDKRIAELEAWACNRVWQDAYNVINEAFCDQQTAKDYADNQLKQFKEENGIDLGGE